MRTSDGTAVAVSDYLTTSAELTIPAGALTTSVTISVVGETLPEEDEHFFLFITDLIGATPGNGRATITILNDDFVFYLPLASRP